MLIEFFDSPAREYLSIPGSAYHQQSFRTAQEINPLSFKLALPADHTAE